ncbi:hypothetical protein MTR_3g062050 [Medicago truncatula]|uniref:Disease resistance protein At4g27190-like leucine-rich repeats domain-containing protein n=1 Tax=Medicago truncatula TaxID=3880 RepID=G7J299_MEDTR|nr:hypothetical protein MTR_3g062050 [Medicago truncatula]
MKSVFILSIAPRMLLETLWIINCDELKYIIIDTDDHDNNGNNLCNIFGHYTDDRENENEIHLHLPAALERLKLSSLQSLIGLCPKQYHTTFPPLKELKIDQHIGDFIYISIYEIMKELSGNVDHFLASKSPVILKESLKREKLGLQRRSVLLLLLGDTLHIDYHFLYSTYLCFNLWCDYQTKLTTTCLFVGPKNSFFLQNLIELKIMQCEKLKIVFPTSIVWCLPQLYSMRIEECKELKHIIEYDLENRKSSNFMSTTKTCFPKLKTLVVKRCNKLKYVFPISICKELLELEVLLIREAAELEEIFVSEGDDHKVEIPNLIVVIFENLPSLHHDQGIQFQAVKHHAIQNCQKLSLALASTGDLDYDLGASEFLFGTHSIQCY